MSVRRELRPQRQPVTSKGSTVCPPVRNRNPRRHAFDTPAPIPGHPGSKPAFAIDGAHQVVDVDDLGLQLDDEEAGRCGVPGKHIDHAPLAEHGEGHLRLQDPAIVLHEACGNRLVHRRMASIQQAPEVSALPSRRQDDRAIERRSDRSDRTKTSTRDPATFDEPHDGPRDACSDCELGLRKPFPDPEGPKSRSYMDRTHIG